MCAASAHPMRFRPLSIQLNSVKSGPVRFISSTIEDLLTQESRPVESWPGGTVKISISIVLLGRTDFDTTASIPDPTLSLSATL